ncbi:MAG: SDR family oxidoreductase [Acidimicrobiales bacterium]|nr:SDR family oxidoreductase [Acidimicrobiales bacterium]
MTLPAPTPDDVVIVTGASSGIGAEIARELARRGHGLVIIARRQGPLDDLATELTNSHSIRVEVIPADLTELDARRAIATTIAERGLRVSGLVNNAGFSTKGPVASSDPDREVSMIRTNVEAVAHLCSLFVPTLVERGAGAVLNVASTAAFQPLPGQAGYAASKAFVLSYTHALRGELRATGVSCTALCPGPVETGFAEAAGFTDDETKALPGFMWRSATEVARQGVDAMVKGRPVVIPGLPNKLGAIGGYLAPRQLLVPILARQHPSLQ